jgi:nicotinate-nucleotide adenylyltransferase
MEAHGRAARGGIALFGGTFDPIHTGHLSVAEAAVKRFALDAVYFIPSARPPHKVHWGLTGFAHRYAMVALGCAGRKNFVPSLAEAGAGEEAPRAYYSIDTVRHFRREFPHEHIYFIVGADSFLQLPTWRSHDRLLEACDFVVASRPGFRLEELRLVIPPELLGRGAAEENRIALRKTRVHLLTTVHSRVSSTEIRKRAKRGASIRGLAPAAVEEYIRKQALYR